MIFDSRSLDRLKQLRREIPKDTHGKLNRNPNNKPITKSTLHKVETTNDPSDLFHSIMDISPDGNVPSHMVSRLKDLETNDFSSTQHNHTDKSSNIKQAKTNSRSYRTKVEANTEQDDLYISFNSLLLEEDL